MAMSAFHITAPAIVAAVGFYFFDKFDSKELGGGKRAAVMRPGIKVTEKMSCQIPKLAPQFDGIYSFETLVD